MRDISNIGWRNTRIFSIQLKYSKTRIYMNYTNVYVSGNATNVNCVLN